MDCATWMWTVPLPTVPLRGRDGHLATLWGWEVATNSKYTTSTRKRHSMIGVHIRGQLRIYAISLTARALRRGVRDLCRKTYGVMWLVGEIHVGRRTAQFSWSGTVGRALSASRLEVSRIPRQNELSPLGLVRSLRGGWTTREMLYETARLSDCQESLRLDHVVAPTGAA